MSAVFKHLFVSIKVIQKFTAALIEKHVIYL